MRPCVILANTSKNTVFNYILTADIALIGVFYTCNFFFSSTSSPKSAYLSLIDTFYGCKDFYPKVPVLSIDTIYS